MPVSSNNKMLTTIAYQLKGQRTYALEGSIFVAARGTVAARWIKLIKQASETGPLAGRVRFHAKRYLVPAFVGLGAPYWNPRVRGALFGLTRNNRPCRIRACRSRERLLPDL